MANDTLTTTFMRLRLRLRSMAGMILGNDDDADDALQDAFCRLWERHAAIDDAGAAEGLTVTAVRNSALDKLRRRKVRSTVDIDENRDAAEAAGYDDDDNDNEVYASVRRIVDSSLTQRQRLIMTMRDIEERSYDEIAAELDMTPENVRVTLSRARKTIREIYRKNKNR